MEETSKPAVYGILEFLNEEHKKPTIPAESKEKLGVAIQSLEAAYGISLKDKKYRPSKSVVEFLSTVEPVEVKTEPVVEVEDVQNGGNTMEESAGAESTETETCNNSNATTGPADSTLELNLGPTYERPSSAWHADKLIGDDAKNKGNEAMRNLRIAEALKHYDEAIRHDGNNAVYFCNRAAALIKLERFDEALRDCQIALQLDPTYARAYGRMGVAYSSQLKHVDAIICYKKALEFEPDNESFKRNLQISQQLMLQDVPRAQVQAAESPNIQGFLTNPALLNMASQMLQDPNMQAMLANVAVSFNAAAGNAGNQNPGVQSFLRIGQAIAQQIQNSNPELTDMLASFPDQQQDPSSSRTNNNGNENN